MILGGGGGGGGGVPDFYIEDVFDFFIHEENTTMTYSLKKKWVEQVRFGQLWPIDDR